MEPFVARRLTPSDPAWQQEIARKSAKTKRRLLKKRWLGWLKSRSRDQERIEREYDASWARKSLAPYDTAAKPTSGAAWQYGDDVMFATSAAGSRARLLVLMRAVALLRPQSVLEVGCGNGLNLSVLACRFPETRFAGVELTEGGFGVARAIQQETFLPDVLQRFSPE